MNEILTIRLVMVTYLSILLGYCLNGLTKAEAFLALIFVTTVLIFTILCKISNKLDKLIKK